jgi:microcystin degradation protein MlrC
MRLVLGAISHETNTFVNRPTDLHDFEQYHLFEGAEVNDLYRGTGTALGGVLASAGTATLIPTLVACAAPAGTLTAGAIQTLADRLVARIVANAGDLDGVLLQLHGTLASQVDDDGKAYILRAIRNAVSTQRPIAVLLDGHANISHDLAKLADLLVGSEPDPHGDPVERGAKAFELLVRTVRREISPTQATRRLPLLVPLAQQRTGSDTMGEIMAHAHQVETDPNVLNVTIAPGFPYADVPFSGFTVVVTTNADLERAERYADDLARAVWERRERFVPPYLNVEDAVHQAMSWPGGPVVLADLGDDPGAGAPGEGTALLWALLDLGAPNAALGILTDPAAVEQAFAAGPGARLRLDLGGRTDRRAGYPVQVEAEVVVLREATPLREVRGPAESRGTLGRSAMLRAEGRHGGSVEILVASNRALADNLAIFRDHGIEPTAKQIVVVKSSVAFRPAFEPIAAAMLEVVTPGLSTPDLAFFDYTNVPRPIFPLDPM